MMDRRNFLRKGLIALAGGLLVGDAALEAFDRLTHQKVWTGWSPEKWTGKGEYFDIVKIKGQTITLKIGDFRHAHTYTAASPNATMEIHEAGGYGSGMFRVGDTVRII